MKKKTKKFGLYAKVDFHIYKSGELIKTKLTNDPDSLVDGALYNYRNCEVKEIIG